MNKGSKQDTDKADYIKWAKEQIRDYVNNKQTESVPIGNYPDLFPELMQASVYYGHLPTVKYLESKGCSLTESPQNILTYEGFPIDESAVNYRKTHYTLLAAAKSQM